MTLDLVVNFEYVNLWILVTLMGTFIMVSVFSIVVVLMMRRSFMMVMMIGIVIINCMRVVWMVVGMLLVEIMIVKALLLPLMSMITKVTHKLKYLGVGDKGRNWLLRNHKNRVVTTNSNKSTAYSNVEGVRQMNPNQRYLGEDISVSDSDVVVQMLDSIGAGVMNSDYTSEELLSLIESSSDSEGDCDGDSDNEGDCAINHGYGSNVDNVTKRKKFPMFRLVPNV